jgi:pilus assembly protein CpaF
MSFELILPFLRPIEPLLLDDSISEIMGNPDSSWWYERDGIIRREESISFDAGRLRTGLEVIANQLGKKLDEDNPVLHAQLPDGSRLAAVIPPVVRPVPAVTIRKFTSRRYTVDDLIGRGTLTRPLADFLAEQIRGGKTLLISGGTGTGKTTLLRILANSIPYHERIVVIEDTSELHIQKPNILAVECQTDTFKTNISFDDLLKSALRWRPDRIILGEVRGIEARTLLDSFNTGHAGSLATIHANSAQKALCRFANLVMRNHAQRIALLLRRESPTKTLQRIVPLERALAPRYLGWLAHENTAGANIYVAANPLRFGSRKRTKESVATVRHLYLDLDTDGEARLASLRASNAVSHTERDPLDIARQISDPLARWRLCFRAAGKHPQTACYCLWRRFRLHRLQPGPPPAEISELQVRSGVSRHRRIPQRFHLESR